MISLTLDELRRIVLETSVEYGAALREGHSIQEAEILRTKRLSSVLRALHMAGWARTVEELHQDRGGGLGPEILKDLGP